MDSILNSIKKLLGIDEEYHIFDTDIIIHVNTIFAALRQMGVGPEDGFSIIDENATWDEFTKGDKELEPVKTYMYLKVKMIFDPPTSSADMEARKQAISEYEWRLFVSKDT